jgi:hypothetical protein
MALKTYPECHHDDGKLQTPFDFPHCYSKKRISLGGLMVSIPPHTTPGAAAAQHPDRRWRWASARAKLGFKLESSLSFA